MFFSELIFFTCYSVFIYLLFSFYFYLRLVLEVFKIPKYASAVIITAVPISAKAIFVPVPPVIGREAFLFTTFNVIVSSVLLKSADPFVDDMFTLPSVTVTFHLSLLIL